MRSLKPPKVPTNSGDCDDDHVQGKKKDISESERVPLMAVLCYRGFEVILAAGADSSSILLICARTRQVFGILEVPYKPELYSNGRSMNCRIITSLHANSFTGLITVVTCVNEVYLYSPQRSSPKTLFGRFEWVPHNESNNMIDYFVKFNKSKIISAVSCSRLCILLACDNMIVLFDGNVSKKESSSDILPILWSTITPGKIRQADLSGDGNSLAAIMNNPSEDKNVHIFRKSNKSGEDFFVADIVIPLPYQVDRISFRGRGFVWDDDFYDNNEGCLHLSSLEKGKNVLSTGNDLLLTISEKEGCSQIFSQRGWKECARWIGLLNSRTVWVEELMISNLGDLDMNFNDNSQQNSDQVGSSSFSKRQQLPHSKQSTEINALPGAWLAEVTVQGHYPALRLSSLVFGEDGAILPELRESAVTILPASSLSLVSMLRKGMPSLWVQGVWSIWNNRENLPRDDGGKSIYLPPAELRLLAPQRADIFSLLEIPISMDAGRPETAQFCSPVRHILSIKPLYLPTKHLNRVNDPKPACMNYMSSKLCAEICQSSTDGRVISFTWIGEGTNFVIEDVSSTRSRSDKKSQTSYLVDKSTLPLKIVLPSLRAGSSGEETVASLNWWPNENFGGIPRLLVLTTSGTISVYELPPPHKALEPECPVYDPLSPSNHVAFDRGGSSDSIESDYSDDLTTGFEDREYEVTLTPHPDFGIGLRLESQQEGLPAVVGSYKKHPLSGGRLPAEKNGMIMIGDELIAVNDESLCNVMFDEIIAAVRRIGASSKGPLKMKFRSTLKHVDVDGSASVVSSSSRRTMEDILGVKKKKEKVLRHVDDESVHTGVIMFEKNDLKVEEWVMTISKNRGAFTDISPVSCASVLPMNYGIGSPSKDSGCSAVLVVAVGGRRMVATRLEVDEVVKETKFDVLGSVDIDCDADVIQITSVKTATSGWCLVAVDEKGNAFLVFIDTNLDTGKISCSFRQYPIFCIEHSISRKRFIVRAASVNYLATVSGKKTNQICIWTSNPMSQGDGKKVYNYKKSIVTINNMKHILDLKWTASGFLDAHPWLVVFGTRSACVLYRPGGRSDWKSIAEIFYPIPNSHHYEGTLSPADAFPHLIPCLRNMINENDERSRLVSDWNVDAILSTICADDRGIRRALDGSTKNVYSWLSQWLNTDKSLHPTFSQHCALSVIPMTKLAEKPLIDSKKDLFSRTCNQDQSLLTKLQKNLLLRIEDGNAKTENESELGYIPPPLQGLNTEELRIIWAIGEIISNPPNFSSVDKLGEFFIFAASLLKLLREDKNVKRKRHNISPIAALSALLCNNQKSLLSSVKSLGFEMLWEDVKSLMIPLWLRDINELRTITEQVAQTTFRSTKKAMDCMLFYIALNKKSTFLNFAKADRSDDGKKLVTFLSNFDFTTQRGRNAAEKNAYSLLRKRRYMQAASFFLLAEPPMLSSALNVIIVQMEDLPLGMLVARLIEQNGEKNGALGKLAGFMSTSSVSESKFSEWEPDFGQISEKIMSDQGMDCVKSDDCLKSILLFWLRKNDKAIYNIADFDCDFPSVFNAVSQSFKFSAALDIVNDLTSFVSRPMILREVSANQRLQWSTALRLSRALSRRGIELTSTKILLQNTPKDNGKSPVLKVPHTNVNLSDKFNTPKEASAVCPTSSIFDSFDMPQQSKSNTSVSKEKGGKIENQSSIFDSYDIPQQTKPTSQIAAPLTSSNTSTVPSVANQMTSSIFDSFDVPSQKKSNSSGPAEAVAKPKDHSSIFDAYDVPQEVKSNTGIPSNSSHTPLSSKMSSTANEMTSSIFDSFDVPQQSKSYISVSKEIGGKTENQSSIFDAYDAPQQTKQNAETVTLSTSSNALALSKLPSVANEMTSSIFDSFDVPSQKKSNSSGPKEAVTKTEDHSSILDAYDVPQEVKSNTGIPSNSSHTPLSSKMSSTANEMTSSIFDSFDVPPQANAPKDSNRSKNQSSIFDAYDVSQQQKSTSKSTDPQTQIPVLNDVPPQQTEKSPTMTTNKANSSASGLSSSHADYSDRIQIERGEEISMKTLLPPLWNEWKETLLADTAARRILREIGFIVSRMQGDLPVPPLKLWMSRQHLSISPEAAHLLQHNYEGNIVKSIEKSIADFCSDHNLEVDAIIEKALLLLGCPHSTRRSVIAVILYRLMNRMDLAEILIRNTARSLIRMCPGFALGNDGCSTYDDKNTFSSSSLLARRQAACVSWQLELCLWLQRGGLFELSDSVEKEATIAVRVGLLISAWNRSIYDLEILAKCEPDCLRNVAYAQELWRSMKSNALPGRDEVSRVHSGGWEFLVDCTRQEAGEILKFRKPGSFLLRPQLEDSSVFTLSFRSDMDTKKEPKDGDENNENKTTSVHEVQHAIVRLSDLGFRCGSFGPFPTLIKLLHAVSDSLPYGLLLNKPPVQALIKDDGKQPSPNAVLIRKLTLHARRPERFEEYENKLSDDVEMKGANLVKSVYRSFSSILILNAIMRHLCEIVTGDSKDKVKFDEMEGSNYNSSDDVSELDAFLMNDCDSLADSLVGKDNNCIARGARLLRPVFEWRRSIEMQLVTLIAPSLPQTFSNVSSGKKLENNHDEIIRSLIKQGSGVDVRTLRVGEGSHSAIVVLFSEEEACSWLMSSDFVPDTATANKILCDMTDRRVIEPLCLRELAELSNGRGKGSNSGKREVRYRFIDPWEIESFEMTTRSDSEGAALGREYYTRFNLTKITRSTEKMLNDVCGFNLVNFWSVNDGNDLLTRALSNTLPPWERSANGDCEDAYDCRFDAHVRRTNYMDSIRRHLYRNTLFRRLGLPQRFAAVIQVDLLDLKNLTSPGGTPSIVAYALLRLKRLGKSSPVTHRVRTLDSASTHPAKIDSSSGPNPSASWQSKTRFRFALPEDVDSFGVCSNKDREALFPGPPSLLQVSVYEKKFITDNRLGSADVRLDGLTENSCLEEWVPLKTGKDGVVWFARMKISLNFKLLCISKKEDTDKDIISVGLRKIKKLSQHGAYEDLQEHTLPGPKHKRSVSNPDLLNSLVH